MTDAKVAGEMGGLRGLRGENVIKERREHDEHFIVSIRAWVTSIFRPGTNGSAREAKRGENRAFKDH